MKLGITSDYKRRNLAELVVILCCLQEDLSLLGVYIPRAKWEAWFLVNATACKLSLVVVTMASAFVHNKYDVMKMPRRQPPRTARAGRAPRKRRKFYLSPPYFTRLTNATHIFQSRLLFVFRSVWFIRFEFKNQPIQASQKLKTKTQCQSTMVHCIGTRLPNDQSQTSNSTTRNKFFWARIEREVTTFEALTFSIATSGEPAHLFSEVQKSENETALIAQKNGGSPWFFVADGFYCVCITFIFVSSLSSWAGLQV